MEVFDVLDFGDDTGHAVALGADAGEDVGLVVVRHGHEGVEAADALFLEQLGVAAVAVDDGDAVVQDLRQAQAAVLVLLDDLDFLDDAGQLAREHLADVRAAHDHDAGDAGGDAAEVVVQGGDVVPPAHQVDLVVETELGVEAGDDRPGVAGDGDHAELVVRQDLRHLMGHLHDALVQQRTLVVDADHRQLEFPAAELGRVRRGVVLEQRDDLVGGGFLGVEHEVEAHLLEHQLVLRREELLVVDAGRHLAAAELLGQQGADDVDVLGHLGIDRDEQVRIVDVRLPEVADRGQAALDRDDVRHRLEGVETLLGRVDDRDLVGLCAQQFGQVGTDLAGPFDDNSHTLSF